MCFDIINKKYRQGTKNTVDRVVKSQVALCYIIYVPSFQKLGIVPIKLIKTKRHRQSLKFYNRDTEKKSTKSTMVDYLCKDKDILLQFYKALVTIGRLGW